VQVRRGNREILAGLFLLAGDVLLLQVMLFAASRIRLGLLPTNAGEFSAGNFVGMHVFVLVVPIGFALARLYPGYGLHPVERLRRRVLITVFGFVCLGAYDYLAQNGLWSRGILLLAFAFALLLPVWDAIAIAILVRMRWWGMPVALFGSPERRAEFSRLLQINPKVGWNEAEAHDWPPSNDPAKRGVTVAVILPPDDPQAVTDFDALIYQHILLVPQWRALQSLNVTARDIGSGSLVLEMRRSLFLRRHAAFKRLVDILIAAPMLLIFAPVIAVSALAVVAASPGWPFYAQVRRGRGGRPILVWKIRTMVPDADRLHPAEATAGEGGNTGQADWSQSGKIDRDPRIVPRIGQFLRRFSIDELPQLWNVLVGDMGLVGPRPLPDYHLALLTPASVRIRELVRPGMTGMWQISNRENGSSAEIELNDTFYVRNWSLWLDFHILLHTTAVVLVGRGAS